MLFCNATFLHKLQRPLSLFFLSSEKILQHEMFANLILATFHILKKLIIHFHFRPIYLQLHFKVLECNSTAILLPFEFSSLKNHYKSDAKLHLTYFHVLYIHKIFRENGIAYKFDNDLVHFCFMSNADA